MVLGRRKDAISHTVPVDDIILGDVDKLDKLGRSALHIAAGGSSAGVVDILLLQSRIEFEKIKNQEMKRLKRVSTDMFAVIVWYILSAFLSYCLVLCRRGKSAWWSLTSLSTNTLGLTERTIEYKRLRTGLGMKWPDCTEEWNFNLRCLVICFNIVNNLIV